MNCPICGAPMKALETGHVLLSYPEQYPWSWVCPNGHHAPGGVRMGKLVQRREVPPEER